MRNDQANPVHAAVAELVDSAAVQEANRAKAKRNDAAPTGQPRFHLPTRTVRTAVVCLPADIDAANLAQRAATALNERGLPTAGVLPHFATRTWRTSKLIDRWQGRTSGGPLKLLDLDGMRRAAYTAAATEWMWWDRLVKGTKPAQPFWWYVDKHHADPTRYPITRAQADYRAQPRILAMTAHNAIPNQPVPLPTAAVEAFQSGYSGYLNLAWLAAVPGDGLAPITGGWLSPPSQGLADQLDYLRAANAHLAGLHPATRLVAVASPV